MVAYYNVFGAKVGSHILSMATLGSVFGGTYLAMRGGGDKKKQGGASGTQSQPPISAGSKEEEAFINEFLKNSETEEKKAKQ